jgi:predicted transcriptional regulator
MSPDVDKTQPQKISLDEYHLALIKEGIRQANAGQLIKHSDVVKMMAEISKARTRRSIRVDH